MSRGIRWTPEKYRDALVGNSAEGVPGLRSIARGFAPSDGFDLRHISEWTPYQKRKLRETFAHVRRLEAQPKLIVRPRSEQNLRKLQESFHADIPSKNLKVAFVPYHAPKVTPGAKKHPPHVRLLKEGVALDTPNYSRVFVPFDKRALVKDARKEIARVTKAIPGASLYFVQCGENQSINGKSPPLLAEQVLKWMAQYDGKRPLPPGSGNRGDDPRAHKWTLWLEGVVGYVLPKRVDVRKLRKIITEGRRANEEQKRKRNNYLRRKNARK